MVFTLDEQENLPQCLDSLEWCDDVVVVDSYSTDSTLDICRARRIPVFQNEFRGFGSQRNWALDNVATKHDWILILDADERVTDELSRELRERASASPQHIGAYRLRRRFYLWGRWLRFSSLYPTWVVRFVHKNRIRFIDRGHAETQTVDGEIGELKGYLVDENLKSLEAWFERQNRYSSEEARFELEAESRSYDWAALIGRDPLAGRAALKRLVRKLPFRGAVYFLYCYVFRLGFLDGRDGYVFCRMKALYESMVQIKKYDARKRGLKAVSERQSPQPK